MGFNTDTKMDLMLKYSRYASLQMEYFTIQHTLDQLQLKLQILKSEYVGAAKAILEKNPGYELDDSFNLVKKKEEVNNG